jgi:hypothetical protein
MRFKHKKRGTVYDMIGSAIAQCDRPIVDSDLLVVYKDPFSGQLWVRPKTEFHDGRFAAEPE